MMQHIAASGLIGVSLWAALFAIKTGEFSHRICAAITLAIGLYFFTT